MEEELLVGSQKDGSVGEIQSVSQQSGAGGCRSSLSSSIFSKAMLSQRIVNIEYYMAAPVKEFDNMYSDFRNSSVKRVPVIRIFGASPAGQKICTNIHGVYPYISVLDDEAVEGFEYRIAAALDNAINESVNVNRFGSNSANFTPTQHVFKVIRVVGRTFYGYRSNNEVFLRIFFYNPLILKKAVDLLQSGNILGRRFQPYEAHISYSLQFMIDYCLYGMNFVHYSDVKFRRNTKSPFTNNSDSQKSSSSSSSLADYFDPNKIDESLLGPSSLTKMTLCEIEVDVIASGILIDNNTSGKAMSVNPGIDSIWKDEIERRRQQGVDSASQITIPDSQDRLQPLLIHSAEEKYQEILWDKANSNFAHDESVLEKSFSQSLLEEEIIPSSQILDHLSAETLEGKKSETNNELTQEEDAFLKLLEEMAAEVESTDVEASTEDQMQQLEEDDNLCDSDVWNDSFSASILEAVFDAEETNEESSPTILQCDGQANDSDISSDAGDLPNDDQATRLSKRIRTRKSVQNTKETNSIQKGTRKSVKVTDIGQSPGSRLSLTVRRQSRSQELVSKEEPSSSTSQAAKIQVVKKTDAKVPEVEIKQRQTRKSLSKIPSFRPDEASTSTSTRSTRRNSELKLESLPELHPATFSKATTRNGSAVVSTANQAYSHESKQATVKTEQLDNNKGLNKQKLDKHMVPFVSLQKIDASVLSNSSLKTRKVQQEPGVKKKIVVQQTESAHDEASVQESSKSGTVLEIPYVRSKRIAARTHKQPWKTAKMQNKSESGSSVDDMLPSKSNESKSVKKTLGVVRKSLKRPTANEGNTSPIKVTTKSGSKLEVNDVEIETNANADQESNDGKTQLSRLADKDDQGKPENTLEQDVTVKRKRGRPKKILESKTLLKTAEADHHNAECKNNIEERESCNMREECNQLEEKTEDIATSVQKNQSEDPEIKNEKEKPEIIVEVVEVEDQSASHEVTKELGNEDGANEQTKNNETEKQNESETDNITKLTADSQKTVTKDDVPKNKSGGVRKKKKIIIVEANGGKNLHKKEKVAKEISSEKSQGEISKESQIQVVESQRTEGPEKPKPAKSNSQLQKPSTRENKVVSEAIFMNNESTTVDVSSSSQNSQRVVQNPIQMVDAEVMCKPSSATIELQTEKSVTIEISIQATPGTADDSSQTFQNTTNVMTQVQTEMISVETQADNVPSLCMCQCSCVYKEKSDKIVDVQDDLKPVMESKRIQVPTVDMIAKARHVWQTTTPQNKTKNTTPLRSPDKRRSVTESPRRRHVTTPTSSRYLSALLLKTPTSHHKSARSLRESPSTPTECNGNPPNATPPSRESKEGYLIHSIRSSSASPRKRLVPVKPKSLSEESICERVCKSSMENWTNPNEFQTEVLSSATVEPSAATVESYADCGDLSVNSIYEYEDVPSPSVEIVSSISITPVPDQTSSSLPPSASLSWFQRKRILSKHRSKIRLEKRKAATLEANRTVPDIFEIEFEPLKIPASYKSTMKWLEAEKDRFSGTDLHKPEKAVKSSEQGIIDESSDEEAPPVVKLFGGGNMSDEEDEDSCLGSSSVSIGNEKNEVQPFTPPEFKLLTCPEIFSQVSSINSSDTPRSILRQKGTSRRQSAAVIKRKIRWEDEEPSKRIKMEVEGDCDMPILTDETLNKTIDTSELDGLSFKNALGLENSMSNFQDAKALHQSQFLTCMCVEVHCSSRNGLSPDPAMDPIVAIFVLISSDYPENFRKPKEFFTVLVVEDSIDSGIDVEGSQSIKTYANEIAMLDDFISLVRCWDPDVLVGFEVEKSSFGYLIQRGTHLGKDMGQELSRLVPLDKKEKNKQYRMKEEWNGTINGRIVLNLWRLLRHEITVQSYTFENAAYHILRRRVYKFSYERLNTFWLQKINRFKVMQYYSIRIRGTIQIMEKLDLINRTSELARLFGIQFYEVLSRGSQFRVESMMLRATKPLDYIAPSPTVMQRAKMRAPEYLPLILEPRSNYYTDPIAVLDFQSLYPSMMIAYNYDYASVLGRVEHLGSLERFALGCLNHQISPAELRSLKESIHISPAGVAFLSKSACKGVVPEMLEQILDTRQMVKRAMKRWKGEGVSLQKVLDSRQLGLKLIANVTYGYTSANFSGRMPCVEIADSIVSNGRETLQRAIDHVKSNFNRWGGEVIYGDTDSLFVLFRGKSREDAFKLAYEIADEVTQSNPKPVKLKFEKIYQPCILQSKKRYVGYAYETPDQKKPVYDAKGIETVRRDGCPAVKKILEKTLHVLFTSDNRVKVEEYIKLQFEKLFKGRVSMQDYIFAREFRGRAGYKPTACVPALEIAKRLVQHDPRAEPLVSERVPYVVIYGNPTLPLIKLVRTPEEYLQNPEMRLNAHYYIEKAIIPAINRCLKLAGMDAFKWYSHLPRKYLRNMLDQKPKGQGTLDGYVLHQNCFKCGGRAERGLCSSCLADQPSTVIHLQEVVRNSKSKLNGCTEICKNCSGEPHQCISIDCPVLHKLTRYERDQVYMKNVERELQNLEW